MHGIRHARIQRAADLGRGMRRAIRWARALIQSGCIGIRGRRHARVPRVGVLLGQMGDVLGRRVLAADGGDADVGGFAGFGEGVVAGVEVFTLLTLMEREGESQLQNGRVAKRTGFTLSLFCRRSFLLGSLP